MGTTAEKLAYLDATKTAIKDAIVAKGVEVPEGTTFRQYADLISGISTGLPDDALALATATPEDVFAGNTFYARDRTLKTGTASAGLKTISGVVSDNLVTINQSGIVFVAACIDFDEKYGYTLSMPWGKNVNIVYYAGFSEPRRAGTMNVTSNYVRFNQNASNNIKYIIFYE